MRATLLSLLVLVAASLGVACAERGRSSPEAVAAEYLAAARRGNESAIVALTPKEFESEAEARLKVAAYALVPRAKIDVTYQPDPDFAKLAKVQFTASEPEFTDTIELQQIGTRWYLMLGRSKEGPPPYPTARASR